MSEDFPNGRTVYRLRAGDKTDPYSGKTAAIDWEHPADPLPIPGAFVAHTSTTMLATATREQALEAKSLFCDGSFDVRKGDRILDGADTYSIDGIPPAADSNPWTGWTPQREIPLTRYMG
jgi:hypothetical protein